MSKSVHYIGIDPGSSSGCIAVISKIEDMTLYCTIEFSKHTTSEWFEELKDLSINSDCYAVLEKVHGMPGMSTVAVSSFMKNVGHIEMALIALNIPFKEVTPQAWMKYYGLKREKDESKTEWKRRLREYLQRTIPAFKPTNDTADAMLIANYCKENA
jgi:Holliday junction resolvasome RuvABC endonuclease subunit